MTILPVHPKVITYLNRRGLLRKFEKQVAFFKIDPSHPSLEIELLEPKYLRLWSFRINKKYRAIFIFRGTNTVEIIDVNNHYR